jgi:hypothetical protein
MWFDHACWYMMNNLGTFFSDAKFPTLVVKYVAYFVWLTNTAHITVHHQITFDYGRGLMLKATMEYANNLIAQLLAKYPYVVGIRKINYIKNHWTKIAFVSCPSKFIVF